MGIFKNIGAATVKTIDPNASISTATGDGGIVRKVVKMPNPNLSMDDELSIGTMFKFSNEFLHTVEDEDFRRVDPDLGDMYNEFGRPVRIIDRLKDTSGLYMVEFPEGNAGNNHCNGCVFVNTKLCDVYRCLRDSSRIIDIEHPNRIYEK